MKIDLNPEQARFIEEEIRSGHFHSPGEVLDHALAALGKEHKLEAPLKPRKNLVEVLNSPPFAGSELDLERVNDYPRPIEL